MKIFAVVLVVLLAGCVTTKQTVGPDGRVAISITCPPLHPNLCLEKAGDTCSHGYDIVAASGSRYFGNLSMAQANAYATPRFAAAGASAFSVPLMSRNTMMVECKR